MSEYLPLKELAKYSGLSVRTLRTHLTSGTRALPYYRLGGKILVRRSDFDAWATSFRIAPGSRLDTMVDDILKGVR
jgi:excisionase family DNA binding protein